MKITLSNIIEITEPTEEILNFIKINYIYRNPNYDKKRRMGFYTGCTAKTIKLYEIYQGNVYLPIGCFTDIWKMYPDKNYYTDYSVTRKINVISKMKLRNYQQPVIPAVKKYCNGIILMPCGTGKSCTLLHTACELQQKTLWLCTTKDLLNQAESYIENFTNATTSHITDGKCDYSGDFVFATIQTLCKVIDREEIPQNTFGCVIGDELQHCMMSDESVMMYKTCMEYFSARYKLGCTATLETANDLWKCIPKIVGSVIYELKKSDDKKDFIGIYENKEIIRVDANQFQVPAQIHTLKTTFNVLDKDVYDVSGRIMFTRLISCLCDDYDRNKQILNLINKLTGYTIVISERVNQLEYLSKNVHNSIFINGKTPKKEREKLIEEFRQGKYKVLFASYSLVAEGLDIPMLENLVMASPVKDQRLVVQAIGRCQRPYKDKKIANIYDLIDDVSMLDGFFRKRRAVYKKEGWEMR